MSVTVPGDAAPRAIPRLLAGSLVVAVALAVCFWMLGADRRALQTLPRQQRLHLYQMTHDSLLALCVADPPPALMDHCRDQARLLLGFPECDPDCQQLARRLIQPRK